MKQVPRRLPIAVLAVAAVLIGVPMSRAFADPASVGQSLVVTVPDHSVPTTSPTSTTSPPTTVPGPTTTAVPPPTGPGPTSGPPTTVGRGRSTSSESAAGSGATNAGSSSLSASLPATGYPLFPMLAWAVCLLALGGSAVRLSRELRRR